MQPAARLGTSGASLRDDLPALKALKASLRDDAPALKAVDALSSDAFIPQNDALVSLRLKNAVEVSDGNASMRWQTMCCAGRASIERDAMVRSQLVSAEQVATEKPMKPAAPVTSVFKKNSIPY